MAELARMTSPEAEQWFATASIGIIPIGALEQHGAHLELRTDSTIATELARRVDAELGSASVLCPLLAYGASEHHLGFAGTVSLRPATVAALLRDVCDSLIFNGIKRILILNGHGGNCDIARIVAREVNHETGNRVAHAMWGSVIGDETSQLFQPGSQYHHACEVETSIAWECDRELVRDDLVQHHGPRSPINGFTDAPSPRFDLPRPFEQLSTDGSLGDPSNFDPLWGDRLASLFVERTVAFARWMIELDLGAPAGRFRVGKEK